MTELPKLIEAKIKNYLYYEVKSLQELKNLLADGLRDRLIFIQYGVLERDLDRDYYHHDVKPSTRYTPLNMPRVLNYHFENTNCIIDMYGGLRIGDLLSDAITLYNQDYQINKSRINGQQYFFIAFQELNGRSRKELACRVFYSYLDQSKNIEKPLLPYPVRRFFLDTMREMYRVRYFYLGLFVCSAIIGKSLRYGIDWYYQ